MRVTKLVVLVLVSFMFAGILAGCQEKEEKVREFIKRYGNVSIEETYRKAGFVMPTSEFGDLEFKIDSLNRPKIKTKEVNGEIRHFVRAKLVYDFCLKVRGIKIPMKLYRWMALTIEEDGFGNLLVDTAKSTEYSAIGANEEEINSMFGKIVEKGENLIK